MRRVLCGVCFFYANSNLRMTHYYINNFIASLFLFLFFHTAIIAQEYKPIQTGPRLSVDFAFTGTEPHNILNDLGQDSLQFTRNSFSSNFGIGMFMQFNIKDYLFFRPEAIVHLSKRKAELLDLQTNQTEPLSANLFAFSMPVHIGYRVEGVSLQLGLVWHNQLRSDAKKGPEDLLYKYKGSHTTFSAGLGYQSGWLLFDIYYEKSLSKVKEGIQISEMDYSLSSRPSYLSVRIGFMISGK